MTHLWINLARLGHVVEIARLGRGYSPAAIDYMPRLRVLSVLQPGYRRSVNDWRRHARWAFSADPVFAGFVRISNPARQVQ